MAAGDRCVVGLVRSSVRADDHVRALGGNAGDIERPGDQGWLRMRPGAKPSRPAINPE
jgi:hypothetical protein